MEDRYRQMDPALEQKIQAIRQVRTASNEKQGSTMGISSSGMHATNQVSKDSFKTSNNNAPTTVDDQSTNKNLSKLEEVLRRQRDRLESMSGSFGNNSIPQH